MAAKKLLPYQKKAIKQAGGKTAVVPTGSGKTPAKKPVKYTVEVDVKVKGGGPLSPGDVVRLRSDRNVQMTIESTSRTDSGLEVAKCVWFRGDSGYAFQETIALAALVRVEV